MPPTIFVRRAPLFRGNLVEIERPDRIEVESLTKLYGDVAAVTDLSFSVGAGEILGLVGPNGAGKTTTLRSVAGIIPPSGGTIHVAGHDLAEEPVEAKSRLAFIPDEPQLFDYLNVQEHLRFIGRIYGVENPEAPIAELLRDWELVDHAKKLPDQLSRGMRQKLAIACGLLHDPSILLFDEPLTGLDPGSIRRIKSTIRSRAAAGGAVILSSHLLHLVEELCDRVLVIQKGRLLFAGTMSEIKDYRPDLEGEGLEDVFLALTEGDP